jgi:hypothetical protein
MASLRRPPTSPPAPHIPEIKVNGVAAEPVAVVSADPDNAAHEYQKETIEADEATLRLRKQLDDLQQSEQIQRQHAERQHQQTQQINQLAEFAASEAEKQGHQRGTDGHLSAAREIFHNHLTHLQAQAQAAAAAQQAAANPAPAPEFSRSSLPPLPPELPERTSHYSAPVSRETPTASGQRTSTTRVTLTAEEKNMAQIAGVSEVEYAKQKQRLIEEKNSGHYGERRYG